MYYCLVLENIWIYKSFFSLLGGIPSMSTEVRVSITVYLRCVYVIITFILLIMSFGTSSISPIDYFQTVSPSQFQSVWPPCRLDPIKQTQTVPCCSH